MTAAVTNTITHLCSASELDLTRTFDCGQCFRWDADADGIWTGVALGSPARLWTENGGVYIDSAAPPEQWLNYFDLRRDYDAINDGFCRCGQYLAECVLFGRGIRILNQDPWEALCSFIISQCNNIPRIKGIVSSLCRNFGDRLDWQDKVFFTFPTAERVAALELPDLAALRCGYRAPYILGAARAVADGGLEFEALRLLPGDEAVAALLKLEGVGPKVASCVSLFGLGHIESFPVDVWMKRALKAHFPPDFKPESLGPYAGLAQQYIFFRQRTEGIIK